MKKNIVVLLILVLSVVFASCGSTANEKEGELKTYDETSLLYERPLMTYDLDLFSISLPMGLSVDEETDDGYYMKRMFYSNYENIRLQVTFEPRETAGNVGKTGTEYAQMMLNAVLDGYGLPVEDKGVYRNVNGNPCFTARTGDEKMYCVLLETEFYFISLSFFADITQYAMYQPYFEAWEASACINQTPTGSILNQQKTWSFATYEISVPAYFDDVPTDTRDLWLWAPQNDIDIQIECLVKNGKNIEEAFLQWLGEGFDSEDVVISPSGNPSCAFLTDDYMVYTCCVESETEYIFAIFTCEEENYADHVRYFRKWESTFVGK